MPEDITQYSPAVEAARFLGEPDPTGDYMSGDEADRFMNVTPEPAPPTPEPATVAGYAPPGYEAFPSSRGGVRAGVQFFPKLPPVLEEPKPAPGSPEGVRQAAGSGRVFGNAPVGPIPPRLGGRVGGRTSVQPSQQAAQAPAQGPPGLEQEPWLPHGEFEATPAQKQLATVYQNGGQIAQDVYHQALRDKQAQQEGMPRDWRPTETEVAELRKIAEWQVPRNHSHYAEAVASATRDLVHNFTAQKHSNIQNQAHSMEAQRREKVLAERAAQSAIDKDVRDTKMQERKLELDAQKEKNRKEDDERKAALKAKTDQRNASDLGYAKEKTKTLEKWEAEADKLAPDKKTPADQWLTAEELADAKGGGLFSGKKAMTAEEIAGMVRTRKKQYIDQKVQRHMMEYGKATPEGKELRGAVRGLERDAAGEPDFSKATPEQLRPIFNALDEHAEDPWRVGLSLQNHRRWKMAIEQAVKKRKAGA